MVTKLAPGPFSVHRGDIVVFKDPGGWLPAPAPPTGLGAGKPSRSVLTFIGLLPQDSGEHLIKRVIGVGGDHVECCDEPGRLVVNGVAIDEPYIAPGSVPSEIDFSVTVPDGYVWVMGDNRQDSEDSRYHQGNPGGGAVPLDGRGRGRLRDAVAAGPRHAPAQPRRHLRRRAGRPPGRDPPAPRPAPRARLLRPGRGSWSAWTRSAVALWPARSASGPSPWDRRPGRGPRGVADSKLLSPDGAPAAAARPEPLGARQGCRARLGRPRSTRRASSRRCGWPACERSRRSGVEADVVLLDGSHDWLSGGGAGQLELWEAARRVPAVHMRVKADRWCASVAAASVLAKCERDAAHGGPRRRAPGVRLGR